MLQNSTELSIGIECVDQNTKELPNAKRGDFSATLVSETQAQLDAHLIWWQCSFCGGYVLIDSLRQTHEKCKCGAKRISRNWHDGWTKDGITWVTF